jgi:ferritin-like metal-binding protein YciE
MSKEGDDPRVQELFLMHADETKRQDIRLTSRLQQLGGSPSSVKGALAHLFSMTPKAGQIGQEEEDKNTHNLIIAYAVEQSEVIMYEALKVASQAVGDTETARLAEEIQREEEMTAKRIWSLISSCSRDAVERQTGTSWQREHGRFRGEGVEPTL